MEKRLQDAPKEIWEYDQESYQRLTDHDVHYSEMVPYERKFVHGLIRYMKPKRILEIGVAEGGGSVVILNAIEDTPETTLTSIDLMETCWNDSTKGVGFACLEKYQSNKQWEMHLGKDPSEIIEELAKEGKFDFLILDTAHVHPIESLNFLSVFPFLTENCTMVLHDIGEYEGNEERYSNFPAVPFACKLLFDTLVGEKRVLPPSKYPMDRVVSNIGVCQFNIDTKKYIGNILSMLLFPWGLQPDRVDSIFALLERYYDEDAVQTLERSYQYNRFFELGWGQTRNNNPLHYNKKKIIFYGYGDFFQKLWNTPSFFSEPIVEVWDKADKESTEEGLLLRKPDYNSTEKEEILIVLSTAPKDIEVQESIKAELKGYGFPRVVHYLELDRA
ncbi:MAG: class I SAM-dependent methyltransferase [Eubacteriales bacterium]